jgi:hypothetical protein
MRAPQQSGANLLAAIDEQFADQPDNIAMLRIAACLDGAIDRLGQAAQIGQFHRRHDQMRQPGKGRLDG